MYSPTLIALAAILAALVTAVLHLVWRFNKHIPGLGFWVLSFLSASVFGANLLVREHMPLVLSVVLAQAGIAVAAYCCFLGGRAYLGLRLPHHGYATAAIVAVVALAVYFTVGHPHPAARFVLSGLVGGVYFLLTAVTLARGGFNKVPARYIFAAMVGFHGAFLLLRPALFGLGSAAEAGSDMAQRISQYVALESTVALVMIAFGTLLLTNEHVTTELRHLAEMDSLTNVFNRRAYLTLLDKAISNAQRTRQGLPVLALDLDHFKKINDTWGHGGGDDVLRQFVALAQQCLRKEDVMGRLGGEEFAIFLLNADGQGAEAVAERLRALVETQPLRSDHHAIPVTVSIGVALCTRGDSAETVLKRADAAMYLAKQNGRNRVEVVASPVPI